MNDDCAQWITAYVKSNNGNVDNMCREATELMVRAIPRLTRHRGYVESYGGARHQHWWCLDGETIVDPTLSQFFRYGGVYAYDEYMGPEPTGKCLDCGELIFSGDRYFCNDNCARNMQHFIEKDRATLNALDGGI